MSAISVVQYQTSPQKLNILQNSQNNNNNNNGREIIILRKPQQILPQSPKEILLTNSAKKKSRTGKDIAQNPPPVAVARRNARERNRVKQVNNGFATLRQHIPNSIAAAFESNNGRGGNKKLSKVETLRMAVEYIRSLEDILAGDEGEGSENLSNTSSYNSSTPSSPAITSTANMVYNYQILSPSNDEDDLSTNPTPPPQYHQRYLNFYEDSENLEPLDDNLLSDPSLMDADIELGNQDLSLLNTMHTTTGSLSPEMYSDNSLSPISMERTDRQMFIPVFNGTNEDIKLRISPALMTEIKTEQPVISLQNTQLDSKENMIQVMAWWEQQQSRS